MDKDGGRIAQNDDGGTNLDARIERDLAAGVYLVEATTAGGRVRGAADFTISVARVAGCEITHLGTLEPGEGLSASGSWSLETCGSRLVTAHPAYNYSFELKRSGLVRIDLTSENGDPVLSLASAASVIGANDDGGPGYNSRIEQYLAPGTYYIEATTYRQSDQQPSDADFDLVVALVDEEARQGEFNLKLEAVELPDVVVAGRPVALHYRVGNVGGGDLSEADGRAMVYAWARRTFYDDTGFVLGSEDRWQAGVSYHSGPEAASATSVAIDELTPMIVTFTRPGDVWLFVGVYVEDDDDNELGLHGIAGNVRVLSAPIYDPVTVTVDGAEYVVAAEADDEGEVTSSVAAAADAEAEVGEAVRELAIFAAGTQALILDDLFQRPALAAIGPVTDVGPPPAIDLPNASSTTLLRAFGERYASVLAASGLAESVAAGTIVTPGAVDAVVLDAAADAAAWYVAAADGWAGLLHEVDGGWLMRPGAAFDLHRELAYAEAVASPLITAGRAVRAARIDPGGWDGDAPGALLDALDDAACFSRFTLADALDAAGAEGIDAMLAADAAMRVVRPVHGLATDAALCAIGGIDRENRSFLRGLGIVGGDVAAMFAPDPPPAPEPRPVGLSIVARADTGGRIEVAARLASGEVVMPAGRFLGTGVTVGAWYVTGDVEADGGPIGHIRARRLADGRVEVGFADAAGGLVEPTLRYLPADTPRGVWLRSSAFEVPPPAAPSDEGE